MTCRTTFLVTTVFLLASQLSPVLGDDVDQSVNVNVNVNQGSSDRTTKNAASSLTGRYVYSDALPDGDKITITLDVIQSGNSIEGNGRLEVKEVGDFGTGAKNERYVRRETSQGYSFEGTRQGEKWHVKMLYMMGVLRFIDGTDHVGKEDIEDPEYEVHLDLEQKGDDLHGAMWTLPDFRNTRKWNKDAPLPEGMSFQDMMDNYKKMSLRYVRFCRQ
jgi:hypothetical protein